MNIFYRISAAILICAYCFPASGQQKSALNTVIAQINDRHNQLPVEKLYIQTDKTYYIQNDTLWFKAYLFNGDDFTPSGISGLCYFEIDDSNNQCIKRVMVPVADGLTWGNIALDADDFFEGGYTLRAYTNWMRNFGEEEIFKKQLYVTSINERSRLITTDFKPVKQAGKQNIQAALLFNNINGQNIIAQNMQLRVIDGKHLLAKATTTTDFTGKLNFNFDLPQGTTTKNIAIITKDVAKGNQDLPVYNIPVTLNRPEFTDLQFMPEGGTFVAGTTTVIGFKAIGEDGKGIDVHGNIYNSKQQQVATFRSVYRGMGRFEFTPQAGESYTAGLILPDGSIKSYPLPVVSQSGVSLKVFDPGLDADSLQVSVSVSHDMLNEPALHSYYLIGLARNVACYGAHLVATDKKTVISVPKSAFPTGIVHFTLLNTDHAPVAERVTYINRHNNLLINITADKGNYSPHDSIALALRITDHTGKPVRGSFSMVVTDDGQVKTDSTGSNIANELLFTSDLKGNVEAPAYYFEHDDAQRAGELDNLLLTQGWIGYNWKQVFAPAKQPEFAAEPEFAVKGKVTNIFNKPVAGTDITLLSKKPTLVIDTLTDKDGRFVFKGFLPVDTASFLVQARNKHGKSSNIDVEVDEFKPPVFTQTGYRMMPWYVNSDTSLLHNITDHMTKQQADAKLQGLGHILQEVKISDKKIIKNSQNLNGPGRSDQVLDEQDMLKAGKMTLLQLLEKKIKGFHQSFIPRTPIMRYMVNDEPVYFVYDGIFINKFYTPTGEINSLFNFVKQFLDYYTAEDVTGVEVMYSMANSSTYNATFLSPWLFSNPIAFIEITTRSGKGPFMTKAQGTYLYKTLAATLPKQFYRPRYTVKDHPVGTDLRSTIHWEPNIITDTAGKATISFYSADKPSTYSIMIEGTDLNGSVGFKRGKVVVK